MTSSEPNRFTRQAEGAVAQSVLLSAQLLALNAALGGVADERAASLLTELARDLRQPPPPPARSRVRAAARR